MIDPVGFCCLDVRSGKEVTFGMINALLKTMVRWFITSWEELGSTCIMLLKESLVRPESAQRMEVSTGCARSLDDKKNIFFVRVGARHIVRLRRNVPTR